MQMGTRFEYTKRKLTIPFILLIVAARQHGPSAVADDTSPKPASTGTSLAADLPKRILEITDAVLRHHIDPPARQQMVLDGLKSAYSAARQWVPGGLSGQVSAAATREQLAALVADCWPKNLPNSVTAQAVDDAFVRGLFSNASGGGYLVSAKDRKVAEQLEGNRYVGVQITLGMNDQEQLAFISQVFEGGPADRAQAQDNDLIETINGTDAKGLPIADIVNRLRGDEGTELTITVRQPKTTKRRTLKMTRAVMPRTTVQGFRKTASGDWDVRLDGPDAIGFLRITDIMASTPHELRRRAHQLEHDGCRALILDFRGLRLQGTSAHAAVLLADSLLDHGTIGRLRTVERTITYQADSDALLCGWPLAALVDGTTTGTAEWLAAALKDNDRAVVVASLTSRSTGRSGAEVRSNVPVGDGEWSVNLVTGYLERGDGRPLGGTALSPLGVRAKRIGAPDDAKAPSASGVEADYTVKARGTSEDVAIDPAVLKAVELLRKAGRKP
jgi:C-terminal peptidase prc